MNKAELIAAVAAAAEISKKDAEIAVSATLDTITNALKEGDKVQLVGFGSFEVKNRAARTGRNPRTKEVVEIPASKVPVFKAGKGLNNSAGKRGRFRPLSFFERGNIMRLDKYLKVSRLIKRRTVANEACDNGLVTVNDKPARASYEVKEGDRISLRFGARIITVEVLSVQETVRQSEAAALYRQI